MSPGTISSHLIKICKNYPDEDLSFYKPEKSILEKVKKVYDKQPKDKPISLKAIFEGLNKKVSYDDIKLSVAFLDSV